MFSALRPPLDLAEECKKYFSRRKKESTKKSKETVFLAILNIFWSRSPIYEELNVLEPKSPPQVIIKDEKEEMNSDLVLQTMNKDYAAFYGNPHLSCHLLQDEP